MIKKVIYIVMNVLIIIETFSSKCITYEGNQYVIQYLPAYKNLYLRTC